MEEAAKWEGKATAKVTGFSPDEVWPLLADFCNYHKWLPGIDLCRCVDGDPSLPGCVRYCARTSATGEVEDWANEKLTAMDPAGRTLSYVVLENSVGFGAYEATIKVVPDVGDGGGGAKGCSIEWSFVADPVVGWGRDGLMEYIDSSLKTMAQRMGAALGSSDSAAA